MVQFSLWRAIVIIALCLIGTVYAAPNLIDQDQLDRMTAGWPEWTPNRQINLGLDLRGGSHLLLEVQTDVVVRDRLEAAVDQTREALRSERVGYRGLGIADEGAAVTFTLREDADPSAARSLVSEAFPRDYTVSREGRTFTVALTEEAQTRIVTQAVEQAIEIVRRRIDETGTREPNIQRQGRERIVVQLPGVEDPSRIKELLGQTARLTFHLVDEETSLSQARQGNLPPGSQILPARNPEQGPDAYVVRRRAMVSGENLTDAAATFQNGQPVVSFSFNPLGARRFGNATTENQGRRFAIVLDGEVISAPVIREPIVGGSGIIEGNFTTETAQNLALLLRAGALPAPLDVVQERTVGPGLGADSIAAGQIASITGLALVIIFMGIIYGRFGLMADVALLVNMVLIVAVLSMLQATLTLPGIAGIVLTIGMAVDANVLVFERIREESRNGRSPVPAVDTGYQGAIRTIIDANVTTLIAAMLLYFFGSGPIRGFAVTLGIGIVTSMFTAIWVTRLMVIFWLRSARPAKLPL